MSAYQLACLLVCVSALSAAIAYYRGYLLGLSESQKPTGNTRLLSRSSRIAYYHGFSVGQALTRAQLTLATRQLHACREVHHLTNHN